MYSITEEPSSTCFGFTPEETLKLLEYYHLKSYEQTVKEWYDGYLFGNKEIYNPWSVLKYVLKILQGNDVPESFWANTSGNDIIYQYIQKADSQMRTDFDTLTSGGRITQTVRYEPVSYTHLNHVLRNVDLSIHKGEFIAVMGPSGSGKSTLLYTISGMDHINSGTVEFDHKEISRYNEMEMAKLRLHEMGFIFQQMHFLNNLNIYDLSLIHILYGKRCEEQVRY